MIVMQGISKSYPPKREEIPVPVLNDVNLRIRPGEYVAFVGPSGSGKSTLMNILGCLDTPSSGAYFLDGVDVSHLDGDALCMVRREKIGFVFQGYQLLGKLTALENVAFPLMLRGISEEERSRRAMEALRRVALDKRASHKPCELSGGQQQRVALARALCYSPKLLLCDEPTGALDEQSRDEILTTFDRLHQSGHTIVIITHDMSVAKRAMRRYIVDGGGVLEEGRSRTIDRSPV
ncbi:MAG: ABC transporter ATP-binding protein [Clostridiales bacterium]|nr:ABC transporter ATP-binding protein [Clostridiales bacterium]